MKNFSFLAATVALLSTTPIIADSAPTESALVLFHPASPAPGEVTLKSFGVKSPITYTFTWDNQWRNIPLNRGKINIRNLNIFTIEGSVGRFSCNLSHGVQLLPGRTYIITLTSPSRPNVNICNITFTEKKS